MVKICAFQVNETILKMELNSSVAPVILSKKMVLQVIRDHLILLAWSP